eukprot:747891-Hanusia_phi.AAC.2
MHQAMSRQAISEADGLLAEQLEQVADRASKALENATAIVESLRSDIERNFEASTCDSDLAMLSSNRSFQEELRQVMAGRDYCSGVSANLTLKSKLGSSQANVSALVPVAIQNSLYQHFIDPSVPYLHSIRFTGVDGRSIELPEEGGGGGGGDARLLPAFLNSSQARKKLLVVLDDSVRLRGGRGCRRLRQVVGQLLETLVPDDLVAVSSTTGLTSTGFASVSYHNLLVLKARVEAAECEGPASSYAFDKLVSNSSSMFDRSDCSLRVCSVILVSDFRFPVSSSFRSSLEVLTNSSFLHWFLLAVGSEAYNLKSFSCLLGGVEFDLSRWNESRTTDQRSQLLDALTNYIIIMAAPLASASEHSLSLPYSSPCGQKQLISLSTPCFQNRNSSSPQLLGVLSLELVFFQVSNRSLQGLLAPLTSVRADRIALNAHQRFQIFFTRVSPGTVFLSEEILSSYGDRNASGANMHYSFNEWTGGQLEASGKLDDIFSAPSGLDHQVMSLRSFVNVSAWLFEPQPDRSINLTFAWRRLPSYPLVVVVTSWQSPASDPPARVLALTPQINTLLALVCNASTRCSQETAQLTADVFVPPSLFVNPGEAKMQGGAYGSSSACASPGNVSQCDSNVEKARWQALQKALRSAVYHANQQASAC